jgi:hypothetical protein
MLLAAGLCWLSSRWQESLMHSRQASPGLDPAYVILASMNSPVAIARVAAMNALFSRELNYLPPLWDGVTLIGASGLLWYWVAVNIDSWRKSGTIRSFAWTPLRVVTDLIVLGICALLMCLLVFGLRNGPAGTLSLTTWQSGTLVLSYIAWVVGQGCLFGYDLYFVLRGRCQ